MIKYEQFAFLIISRMLNFKNITTTLKSHNPSKSIEYQGQYTIIPLTANLLTINSYIVQ